MRTLLKRNLAVRAALATAGLMSVVLALVTVAGYAATALLIRSGTDAALLAAVRAALPGGLAEPTSGSAAARATGRSSSHEGEEDDEENDEESDEHGQAERYRSIERDDRRVQVADPAGNILFAPLPGRLPVDRDALAAALADGHAFVSVVGESVRPGPNWWLALSPQPAEQRVLFLRAGTAARPLLLQVAVPVGPAAALLPALARWLALLALAAALVSGLIAWRMSSAMYRPIRAITETAGQIDRTSLGIRMADVWSDDNLRRLVAVLNEMMARLEAAFDAQGRFAAAAAHELRGPLAAMRAELEVALRRDRSPEHYRKALEGALEETQRLSLLAERLLLLARSERQAGVTIERGISVGHLLDRAVAEAVRATGGEVRMEVPPGLAMDGDPLALERAVANLVQNALQAGGSPVTVRAVTDGARVAIEVSDNGPGIPEAQIPLLFEPFFRGDPARTSGSGAGLGLAIVKAVADAHHGRVTVQSRVGSGSLFRLELPREQAN